MNNNYNGRNRGGNGTNRPSNPRQNPGQNRPGQSRQYNPQQSRQYSGTTPYPPVRHKSRSQVRKATFLSVLCVVILAMLLVSVIIFISRCAGDAFSGAGKDTESEIDVTTPLEETLPDESTAETEPPIAPDYEYIMKNEMDVHRGYQILINYDNEFDFSTAMPMDTLYANKNGVFQVSNINDPLEKTALANFVSMMQAFNAETGKNDIIVTSSYRTLEAQQNIWDKRVDTYGEEYARLYVAEPGHSEHHSGLAVDLSIYNPATKVSSNFDKSPEYPEWLTKNAHRFGFIERYKADKTDITKIAYENWHYRYIGKPHAYYMLINNLCLEEYIEALRAYSYGNELTFTDDEGTAWEIYFVPAVIGGETHIPVPIAGNYELSGNNVDGFIVTVRK